jgi:hypothetical protein
VQYDNLLLLPPLLSWLQYARYAAHRKQYFYQSKDFADATNTDMLQIQIALLDIVPGETNVHQQLQDLTLLDHGQPADAPSQVRFWVRTDCTSVHGWGCM